MKCTILYKYVDDVEEHFRRIKNGDEYLPGMTFIKLEEIEAHTPGGAYLPVYAARFETSILKYLYWKIKTFKYVTIQMDW